MRKLSKTKRKKTATDPLGAFHKNFFDKADATLLMRKIKEGLIVFKNLPWQKYAEKISCIVKYFQGNAEIAATFLWNRMRLGIAKFGKKINFDHKNVGEKSVSRVKNASKNSHATGSDTPSQPEIEPQPHQSAVDSPQIEKILADRLPALMRTLNQACQQVEKDFFRLGEELQSLYSDTEALTGIARQTVQESGSNSGGAGLAEIINSARGLLGILDQDHTIISANLERIATVVQRLKRLLDQSITIKKLGKTLRMIGLNISIESARNLEAFDIFNDLAMQIRTLSDTVGSAAVEIQQDTQAAQSNLSSLHADMDHSLKQLKELGASAQLSMAQAVPEVEKVIAFSTDLLCQTRDKSEQISRQVGQIVMDIQLHDSVSQRIEHIGLALIEAHVTLISTCRKGDDSATAEALANTYSILKLQTAQVDKIIEEIRDIFKSTLTAFEEIKAVINALVRSLSALQARSEFSAKAKRLEKNPIEALTVIFSRLNDLIKQGDLEMGRADNATSDSQKTAERLSQHAKHIRDLNFEIHLKALNAIASSLRLGDKGKTIEVLVQDMKSLAIQSNDYVIQIESVIKDVINESGLLQTQKNRAPEEEENQGEAMEELLKSFSFVCSRFEAGIDEAMQVGAGLDQRIEAVRSKLLFLEQFADKIYDSGAKLDAIVSELQPFVNENLMSDEEMHAALSKRYTTQQERDIHDRMLKKGVSSKNMEGKHQKNEKHDEIELFDTDKQYPRTNETSQTDGSEDNFGDNVELF